jgi:hypothetical protein
LGPYLEKGILGFKEESTLKNKRRREKKIKKLQ